MLPGLHAHTLCASSCLLGSSSHLRLAIARRACFGTPFGMAPLVRTLEDRRANPVEKSYTNRLLNDTALLNAKIQVRLQGRSCKARCLSPWTLMFIKHSFSLAAL